MKLDIILITVPKVDHNGPYAGPYILKTSLKRAGFSCKVFDFNRDLYNKVPREDMWVQTGCVSFAEEDIFNNMWDEFLEDISLGWIKKIKDEDPEWLGISLLSWNSDLFIKKFLPLVRKQIPKVKIIVGGTRAGNGGGEILKERGLVDHYISGPGEIAIVELLKGNTAYPGIDSKKYKMVNINHIDVADYSDIEFTDYKYFFSHLSWGCINHCGFCSEANYKKGFQSRNPENTIKEMNQINAMFGVNNFLLSDSLINGIKKDFLKFIKLMKGNSYTFGGHYLINDWMTETDFKNASESGLGYISVGIETGCERIRKEMGKNITNKMIFNTLEYCSKYNISVIVLMIIGWPTETEEDFQETLEFVTKIQKYKCVKPIRAGVPLILAPTSPATKTYNVKFDKNGDWYNDLSNYEHRMDQWNRFIEHCSKEGEVNTEHKTRLYLKSKKIKKYNI
jgi:radical SAM superfamily enzyme YgiQ (UPF0313 family)